MSEASAAGIDHMRQGPLDGTALPDGSRLSVRVAPPFARSILRGGPDLVAAAAPLLGLTLPTAPNCVAQGPDGTQTAIWLGPDEWLLIASAGSTAAALRAPALAAVPHSLIDVSHRQIGLVLSGPLAARVLSAGCPLDLRLSALPPGMATRTIFLKSEIVLWRQADERFHIEVWRSFAPYLVGHLREAITGALELATVGARA